MLALMAVSVTLVRSAIAPSYIVEGTLLLTSPAAVTDPVTGQANSYVRGGNLKLLGLVVTTVLNNDDVRDDLRRRGAVADYEIGQDARSAAPLIGLRAEAPTPEAAKRTAALVLVRLEEEMARRQGASGAPPSTWISSEIVRPPSEATRSTARRDLATVGVVLGVAIWTMSLLRSRRPAPREELGTPEGRRKTLDR